MVRVLIFLALMAQPALANGEGGALSQCQSFAYFAKELKAKHGEEPIARYIAGDGITVIWGNPESQSWTITLSKPQMTCIMKTGTGWQWFGIGSERS